MSEQVESYLLEEALSYAGRGWPVFPLHTPNGRRCSCGKSNCRSVGKHPRTAHGLKDATTDETQIRGWWTRWPDANIGIATGRKSGMCVLDVDGSSGNESLAKLTRRHGALPETRSSVTGKGSQLFFASPGADVRNSARKLGPGLDIRGEGGSVVAPPSLHANGRRYRWQRECELAQMPDWLLMLVTHPKAERNKAESGQEIPEGRRNDTLTRLAGKMRRAGMTFREIEPALQQINRSLCRPPLIEQEVRGIAESVCRYPAGAGKSESLANEAQERIGPYTIEGGRMLYVKNLKDGPVLVPLSNFVARITEELILDDGKNTSRAFTVDGRLAGGTALPTIRVPSTQFGGLSWVLGLWGCDAVVGSGISKRDQLREAIQLFSNGARRRHIYTHTGWVQVDEQWIYLTAAGALGRRGIEVDLGAGLDRYRLPAEPRDVIGAMRQSLALWRVAPLAVTVPLWAAQFRAPLAPAFPIDFSLWLEGQTGSLKSTLAALFLSHFGDFDRLTLPGSWMSTANQLERRAFALKDMVFVVDDYAPGAQDSRELEIKASRLLRAQGNRQGRGRLRADLSERPEFPPRGLILLTGEQHPPGQSVLARTPVVVAEKRAIKMAALTEAQNSATQLCHAMAAYIQWLAPQMKGLSSILQTTFQRTRELATNHDEHLRIPEALAHLWLGVNSGLDFAEEIKACDHIEAEDRRAQAWDALLTVGRAQGGLIQAERPARRFLRVLQTLIAQGRALLLEKERTEYELPKDTLLVGWYDSENLYLIPDAAFHVVSRFCRESGELFPIRQTRLYRDLREGEISECDPGRTTTTARVGDLTRRVVKLRRGSVERFLGVGYPVGVTEITAFST